jgi:hypothetical protein
MLHTRTTRSFPSLPGRLRRHKHILLWLICFFLIVVRVIFADTGQFTAGLLKYRETTGSRSSVKHYAFEKTGSGYALRLSQDDIAQEILCDAAHHTLTERYTRTGAGDNITVRREADRLVFTGSAGGRPVCSQAAIGNDLWYGSKLLLRGFILSHKQSEVFYMTKPEEQKVIKLRAEKQGREEIALAGSRITAVKIKCTLPDYPLVPWKSFFWYRASDGILLKSEERRGPPWEPLTVVELTHEDRKSLSADEAHSGSPGR